MRGLGRRGEKVEVEERRVELAKELCAEFLLLSSSDQLKV